MHSKKYSALFILISIAAAAAIVGCAKHQFLPVTGTPSKIFTVTKLAHTADSVNVGDTLQLAATGTVSDTTGKAIYAFLTSTYSANGATVVQTFGTAASPIKLKYTAISGSGGFTWTDTIPLIGATAVPHKTKLTIAATFQYQLSLSSELPSSLLTPDAGQSNKTIYVR